MLPQFMSRQKIFGLKYKKDIMVNSSSVFWLHSDADLDNFHGAVRISMAGCSRARWVLARQQLDSIQPVIISNNVKS